MLSVFQKTTPLGWVACSEVAHRDTGTTWRPQPKFRYLALLVLPKGGVVEFRNAEHALRTEKGESLHPIGIIPAINPGWRGFPHQDLPRVIPANQISARLKGNKACYAVLYAVLQDTPITGEFLCEGKPVKVRELPETRTDLDAPAPECEIRTPKRWPLAIPFSRPIDEDESVRYPAFPRQAEGLVAIYDFSVYTVIALRIYFAKLGAKCSLSNRDARIFFRDGKGLMADGIVMRNQVNRSSSLTLVEDFEYGNVRHDSQVLLKPRARMLTLNEYSGPETCRWHDHVQLALAYKRFEVEEATWIEIVNLPFHENVENQFQ